MKLRFLNISISSNSSNSLPVSTIEEEKIEDAAVCQMRTRRTIYSHIIVPKAINLFHHPSLGKIWGVFSWWINLCHWIIHKGYKIHQFFTIHRRLLVVVSQNCCPWKSQFHSGPKCLNHRFSSIRRTWPKYIIPWLIEMKNRGNV